MLKITVRYAKVTLWKFYGQSTYQQPHLRQCWQIHEHIEVNTAMISTLLIRYIRWTKSDIPMSDFLAGRENTPDYTQRSTH